ncbi:MAG: hypothetical protein KBC69_00205 [Candidatus Magasanikbacteria bacterium]|nr:hypothetical protein [Candidatus Magasanikbacteria bacterium]
MPKNLKEDNGSKLPQTYVGGTGSAVDLAYTTEDLKSFFYLTNGKLDSNIKIFKRKVFLNVQDIIDLNDLIQEKLKNHNTVVSVASINISFNKNKMKQFGAWREFLESNWSIPEVVENITMIWDFLVKLPSYIQPQRHTLTVRISANTDFATILPALLTGKINEADTFELKSSPVVCQVDFINHLLSDELINIVDGWVSSRKIAAVESRIKKWIQEHKKWFYNFISYSIPIFISAVSLGAIYGFRKSTGDVLNVDIMFWFMCWLLLSIVGFFGFVKISGAIAHFSYHAISEYGDFLVFNITNGDKNKQCEIDEANKNKFTKFLFGIVGSILINMVAGLISVCLFK